MIKKILITAGPTREHLDPVRFISNLSTGEMGYVIAAAAKRQGYVVTLVSGPTNLKAPQGVKFYPVITAEQMKKICTKLFRSHDCLIMTAAVCDFAPEKILPHKMPSTGGIRLNLKRTPDILAALAKQKKRKIVIGFCLETKDLMRRAALKLHKKNLDGIVANAYSPGKNIPFGKRPISVALLDASGKKKKVSRSSKPRLARRILTWMKSL